MNNVTLGKYLPLDSFVHKLDPRIKICIMVVLMVAVFLPCGFVVLMIIPECVAGACIFGL